MKQQQEDVDKLVHEAETASNEALEVSKRLKHATKLYRERLEGKKQ